MSSITSALSVINDNITRGKLRTLIPEPRGSGNVSFGQVLNTAGNVATSLIGVAPDYQSLLLTQMQMQQQMQQVSMLSNIERSRHESKMAAIRNVRTG